jgi:hypothetical protein
MYNPYQEQIPRVFAEIKDDFLYFECPNKKCEHHNEIGSGDDETIENMKLDCEYDYQCKKCNLDLEIIIY